MKKIVLTGGGTAGHVVPNLALLPYLADMEVHYVGSDGIEKSLVASSGVIYHEIPCVKLVRSLTPKNLGVPLRLTKSVLRASTLLREIRPDVIFSKGGFVGLPVALAAKSDTPLILHESDMTMGLANRLAYAKCDLLLTSFDGIKRKKAVLSGTPLRKDIYFGNSDKALLRSGLQKNEKPFLLAFGGSLGARSINDAVRANLDALLCKYNVVHITGKGNKKGVSRSGYYETEYDRYIYDFFALADVVVTRGGANSLFELVALKKPTLCVPLPKTQSRGDQLDNAAYFKSRGCVNVLFDNEFLCQNLLGAVEETLLNAHALKKAMSAFKNADGTKKIADVIRIAATDKQRFFACISDERSLLCR